MVGDVVVPLVAEAVLVTPPASRSACVVVYDPVQVIDAPAMRTPPGRAGQDTEAILLSLTEIGETIDTVPLFWTTKV